MPISYPKVRIAVVQAEPAWLDLEASVVKTIQLIEGEFTLSIRY